MTAPKLHYADEPEPAPRSEQRGNELRMLHGIAAILEVTATAAKAIGKEGASPTLANSVSKVTMMSHELIELVRSQLAQQGRNPDQLHAALERAGADMSFWNK